MFSRRFYSLLFSYIPQVFPGRPAPPLLGFCAEALPGLRPQLPCRPPLRLLEEPLPTRLQGPLARLPLRLLLRGEENATRRRRLTRGPTRRVKKNDLYKPRTRYLCNKYKPRLIATVFLCKIHNASRAVFVSRSRRFLMAMSKNSPRLNSSAAGGGKRGYLNRINGSGMILPQAKRRLMCADEITCGRIMAWGEVDGGKTGSAYVRGGQKS